MVVVLMGGRQDINACDAAMEQVRGNDVLADIHPRPGAFAEDGYAAAVHQHPAAVGKAYQQGIPLPNVDHREFQRVRGPLGREGMPGDDD